MPARARCVWSKSELASSMSTMCFAQKQFANLASLCCLEQQPAFGWYRMISASQKQVSAVPSEWLQYAKTVHEKMVTSMASLICKQARHQG